MESAEVECVGCRRGSATPEHAERMEESMRFRDAWKIATPEHAEHAERMEGPIGPRRLALRR